MVIVCSDLTKVIAYTDEKFSELSSNLTSHTHERLALVDQDVKIGANPTFGTMRLLGRCIFNANY